MGANGVLQPAGFEPMTLSIHRFLVLSGLGQVPLDERRSKRGRRAEGEDHQVGGGDHAAPVGERVLEGQRQPRRPASAATAAATTSGPGFASRPAGAATAAAAAFYLKRSRATNFFCSEASPEKNPAEFRPQVFLFRLNPETNKVTKMKNLSPKK